MFHKVIRNIVPVTNEMKSFKNIPRPPQLPILGNWHLYKLGIYNRLKYQTVLEHLSKTYGPVVYERIGFREPIIHVFDPDDAMTVYRSEDKMPVNYPLSEFTKKFRKDERLALGLGNSNNEDWYRLAIAVRKSMLKTNNVRNFLPILNAVTDDLIHEISLAQEANGEVLNLLELLGLWSQESMGCICLGKRLGYLNGTNKDMGRKIFQIIIKNFEKVATLKFSLPLYKYLSTPTFSELMEGEEFIHKTIMANIKEALQEAENNDTDDTYLFLKSLLQQKELSVDDVIVIALSLYTDSLSTTVPILLTNLYCLATNRKVQEKAYQEICSLAVNGNKVTSDILDKMSYLKAVNKEVFRMYPNGTEIARINKKPLILSGYHIPENSKLSINMLVNYRSEKYFSEPNTFKPERWIRGNEKEDIHPYLSIPFGHGARTCTGRKFAEQDLLLSLFKILKHYRLEYPADGPEIDVQFHTLLFPRNITPIKFVPR